MWYIKQMLWSTSKIKLSYHDWSDWAWFVMKSSEDNNVTNCIGLVYVEIKIKLTRLIELGVIYDENKTWQWRDQLDRCNLHRK